MFFFHNLIENELLFRCSIQIKKFTASLSCVFYRISSTRKQNYFHVFQSLYDLLSSVGHKRRCLEGCSCCSFPVNHEQEFSDFKRCFTQKFKLHCYLLTLVSFYLLLLIFRQIIYVNVSGTQRGSVSFFNVFDRNTVKTVTF